MVCSQGLEFEAFPAEVRLMVYRELLISEDGQMLDPMDYGAGLHPQILACNRQIHDEAAAVLYGENRFTWLLLGNASTRLWQFLESEKDQAPASLQLSDHQAVREAYNQTLANMEDVCNKLSPNDLKLLRVYYIDSCTCTPHQDTDFSGWFRFAEESYIEENCLLPLLKVRATQFEFNGHASPAFTARLKAKIEGPKDADFLSDRQHQMEESESDFDACEEEEENEQYGKKDEDERVEEGE